MTQDELTTSQNLQEYPITRTGPFMTRSKNNETPNSESCGKR